MDKNKDVTIKNNYVEISGDKKTILLRVKNILKNAIIYDELQYIINWLEAICGKGTLKLAFEHNGVDPITGDETLQVAVFGANIGIFRLVYINSTDIVELQISKCVD